VIPVLEAFLFGLLNRICFFGLPTEERYQWRNCDVLGERRFSHWNTNLPVAPAASSACNGLAADADTDSDGTPLDVEAFTESVSMGLTSSCAAAMSKIKFIN
jgi:hypothetical protein